MVATEFGRTAAVNGTGGTDHGTGAVGHAARRRGHRRGRVTGRLAGAGAGSALRTDATCGRPAGWMRSSAAPSSEHFGVEPGRVMRSTVPGKHGCVGDERAGERLTGQCPCYCGGAPLSRVPAKAGTQSLAPAWAPACAGALRRSRQIPAFALARVPSSKARAPMTLFARFADHVDAAVDALVLAGTLARRPAASGDHGRTAARSLSHGDLATNAAMVLAKPARTQPRILAEALAESSCASWPEVTAVAIAGPGFLNLKLTGDAWRDELMTIREQGLSYGRSTLGRGAHGQRRIRLRPIRPGPMHMGHCRGAVVGDALASLLEFAGHRVDPRILRQRCRRAGRRARPIGAPAVPPSAGPERRRDPRGVCIPATILCR